MFHRRVIYALALAGALAFQITNDNYLAHFLLALCLAMPALSLLLSLPGMTSCRMSAAADRAWLTLGEKGQWMLSVENWGGLPLAQLRLRVEYENRFTGKRTREKLLLSGVARRRPLLRPVWNGHCGLLECAPCRVRVYDCLGLFSLRRPSPEPARLLVLPEAVDPGPIHIPESQGVRPAAGAVRRGPGEDWELREYRPGDPMRSVHWKLSSKWDELIVREAAESAVPLPLLTFDCFGDPARLDKALGRLLGYCRAFLAVQRPHAVLWLDGEEQPRLCVVSDEKELRDCFLTILSAPAPAGGVSVLERPELLQAPGGAVFHLHIAAGEEAGHG